MKNYRTDLSQRVRYAIIAGMAGVFLIPQVGFAAPTGGTAVSGGATIPPKSSDMNITSSSANNVITWQDYSIAQGERVQYDGGAKTNNYLNIVTGANTSNINGTIEGGKDVYIVNPNGVIFGKTAEVNVGNLYVSTQERATLNEANFTGSGASPLVDTAALKADVVNMGKITATSVEVHGSHIRFLNAADVTTTDPVVLHTDTANGGYAHIGYEKAAGAPAAAKYQVNGAAATAADNYYQLVSTKEELAAINTTNLAGNYMLADDIDLANAAHTPIGGNSYGAFTGKFDGNFFQIKNIEVSGVDNAGLFGVLNGASIYNVGVVGGTIASSTTSGIYAGGIYAGGIAGDARNSHLYNVYVKGTKVNGEPSAHGGLVGHTTNTTIDGAYSKAQVGVDGVGIVGYAEPGTKITNTYNDSVYIAHPNTAALFLGVAATNTAVTIGNSYTMSRAISIADNLIEDKFNNVFGVSASAGKMENLKTHASEDAHASSTYSGFSINNDGTPGAKWRIYEGRTLPLLTAFMNGRVDSAGSVGANYSYRKFNQGNASAVDSAANAAKSNNHADITGLTYDSKIVKIVDGDGNIGDMSNVTYDKTLRDDQKNTVKMYTDTGSVLDTTKNVRNAGTKAILWSDQDGPNLRNVNVTINKRSVTVENSNIVATRRYDGTRNVTAAYNAAIRNGGITAGGITPEDIADGSVTITTSTDFKAEMDDKHVGEKKPVTLYGSLTFGGSNQGNYAITAGDFIFGAAGRRVNGAATITKAPLILKVTKDASSKIYDGTDTVTDTAMRATTNVKLNESLIRTGETDAANIKTDGDTNRKDDVGMDTISDPTYINKVSNNAEIHANVAGTAIRYTNVKLKGDDATNYELYYQLPNNTQTPVTGDKLDLTGTIDRRQIKVDNFKVYNKDNHVGADATKVYDGKATYSPDTSKVYLSSNQADANDTTGVVARDQGYITFALTPNTTATFKKSDGTTDTKNVTTADKIAYNVGAQADVTHTDETYHEHHLLSDYWVSGDKDTPLTSATPFDATGAGKITTRVLTPEVVSKEIKKTYDGTNAYGETGGQILTLKNFADTDTRTNTSTLTYASKNVVSDTVGSTEKPQDITYHVSFADGANVEESDNYTLDPTGATIKKTLDLTQNSSGGHYTGTILRRPLTLTMGTVSKIYDGTAENKVSGITGITNVAAPDTGVTAETLKTKHTEMLTAGTAESSYGIGTGFQENVNAGNKSVRYTNMDTVFRSAFDAVKNNYTVDATIYGAGTITRRRIDPASFNVYKTSDNTPAAAKKVYDGTSKYTPDSSVYLSANTAAVGDTGIVSRDYNKVKFALVDDTSANFTMADGTTETSHVSEASRIAYKIVATTTDRTNNPLTNYEFGTAAAKRNLETVNENNPGRVSTTGSITPASIQATTHEISKVYDAKSEHRDANREIVKGDSLVTFTGWVSGQTRDNTSTALYATKDVARDSNGNVIKKSVTYTAQLTGQYADDYQIVNGSNAVISTLPSGSGATKTVTANLGTVANAGTITPRALNITMASVSKVYDTDSTNTAANNTATNQSGTVASITDTPASSKIADILSDDHISKESLGAAWRALRDGGDATSDYGHRGNTPFYDANASAAAEGHDVKYTDMDTAFKNQFGATAAGNYDVDATVYGKGTITPKAIDPNNFNVEDRPGHAADASKVYDGTSDFTVDEGWKIRPSTGARTGLFSQDANRVKFILSGDGAYFIDKNGNKTAHATNTGAAATDADAAKVSYHVTAKAEYGFDHLLKNYTLNGKTLDSGEASVTGAGKIERRTINVGLAEKTGIDKVYDRSDALVNGKVNGKELHHNVFVESDSKANVGYAAGTTNANKLARKADGTPDATVQVTAKYADTWTVARNPSGKIIEKNITYKVSIADDAGKNYMLSDGTNPAVNAETGLTLSATGKITPKDLSYALKNVTKEYDGTTNVPSAQVGFKPNAVISGDVVNLATHNESFQSENVNGDGTTETIDGTAQKNWVNYANLSLTGADAGNYKISSTAKGLGEITPFKIDSNTAINYGNVTQATKIYDGTQTVKRNESADFRTVKGYIEKAEMQVGTQTVNLYGRMSVTSATYDDTKDVNNGTAQGVTYKLTYTPANDGNIVLAPNAELKATGTGVITKRDVNVTVKNPLTKAYDAGTAVKDSAGNLITEGVLNNLITLDGLTKDDDAAVTKSDGTTYTTTAIYTDKNAGTDKQVNYTLTLDTNAGNYNLRYTNAADHGTYFSTGDNTITRRKVNVDFDDVNKEYDGTPTNTSITPSVSDADAAVLRVDSAGNVNGRTITHLTLTNARSEYGKLSDTGFTPDGNAGDKTVRYYGIGEAMGTVFGANNYDFVTNDGKGTITKANIKADDVDFAVTGATKTYDGTRTVKHLNSSASDDVRKYITRAGVWLNGNWVPLKNDLVMDMDKTKYDDENAGTGIGVTYQFHLKNDNINISGDNNFTKRAQGEIKRRVLNLDLAQKSDINKIYDTKTTVYNTEARHYNAFVDHDALGNVIYAAGTTDDNKLVRKADGTPNATVTVTAEYANKNAGVNKTVNYTVRIAGNMGKNYTLKYGTNEADAEIGLNSGEITATGTITPRKLTLTFKNDATKAYDTLSDNTTHKNLDTFLPDNSDGHRATVAGEIANSSFGMTNVVSDYGSRDTDGTFRPDPNVVAGGKDVQYRNLAGTLAGKPYAGNYEVADTSYARGMITRRDITQDKFKFKTNAYAEKEYDGTRDVKWQGDKSKIGNYFTSSTVEIDGVARRINLTDITVDPEKSRYTDKNVAAYQRDADGRHYNNTVDYYIAINPQNFNITDLPADGLLPYSEKGRIIPKNIAPYFEKHIIKEYDGTEQLSADNVKDIEDSKRLDILVPNDHVTLDVKGAYMDTTRTRAERKATAETKADAKERSDANAGLAVRYDLTLNGTDKNNYTIGRSSTDDPIHTGTLYGTGDIYKKTLTVNVDRVEKVYDGTRTVLDRENESSPYFDRLRAGHVHLGGIVKDEDFVFDQTAADQIDGLYATPNVEDAQGSRVHTVSYRGLQRAFADNATRGRAADYARNYRVDDAAEGTGVISPREVTRDDFKLNFDKATKTYDGTATVKPNKGTSSLNDLLRGAFITINGRDIPLNGEKRELGIASGTYDAKDAGARKVTYALAYTGSNLTIKGDLTKENVDGQIDKRKVTVDTLGPLSKTYDGTGDVTRETRYLNTGALISRTDGDGVISMSREDGDTGLLSTDGSYNASTARFYGADAKAAKAAGNNKSVAYTAAIGGANAGNYELVDTNGNKVEAPIIRDGNVIEKRTLHLSFKDVAKEYDTTSANTEVKPYVGERDAEVLRRDGMRIEEEEKERQVLRLEESAGGRAFSIDSRYGRTDGSFVPDVNAGGKRVQYCGVGDAVRTILGENTDNYDLCHVEGDLYGKGEIQKARISQEDFNLLFRSTNKEYDGNREVTNPKELILPNSSMHLPHTAASKNFSLPESDIASYTGQYRSRDAGAQKVDYEVKLKDDNFRFGVWNGTTFTEGVWDGVIRGEGDGVISKRKIIASAPSYLTKEYDGTADVVNRARDEQGSLITRAGDGLLTFRHYNRNAADKYDALDGLLSTDLANGTVANATTASYADKNVAWEKNVWNDGKGTAIDKDVNYTLGLSGADAENYEIVNADGTALKKTVGKGRITPKEILLKADSQTRWINEGLPDSYSGTPMGSNLGRKDVPELVPGEVLPGQIEYSSPNARLRWGDYAINGTYRAPNAGTRYQLLDGTWTTQSFAGGDGDAVSRNYRFVQDPANATAFHMGPYVPDNQYYKALTQASKMLPNEYAYEHATFDYRSHFGRSAEAEISYAPPSINMVKDGVDISRNGIEVMDETVFRLVNEVFG